MAQSIKVVTVDLSRLTRKDQELINANPSLGKLVSSVPTPRTGAIYCREVEKFCKWMSLPVEKVIHSSYDWSAMANDYLASIEKTKKVRTRRISISALNKWFEANGVKVFEKLARPYGALPLVSYSVLPKSTLEDVLLFADLPSKVVILLAISTGLSANQISGLKLRDVHLDQDTPIISIQDFRTFTTSETKRHLEAYLRLRKKRGDILGPESFVIEKGIGYGAIEARWKDSLQRAGIPGIHFTALKDFFKSWLRIFGINPLIIDYFVGGSRGVQAVKTMIDSDLKVEYIKALPALTFFDPDLRLDKFRERVEFLQEKNLKLLEERNDWRSRYQEQKRINRGSKSGIIEKVTN